jgi:hypothetical protein
MVEDASRDRNGDTSADGEWLTIAAAARQLKVSSRAIRGRIDRGTIQWKAAGNAGKLVLVHPEDTPADDPGAGPEDEVDRLREELMEARVAQARAEERAAALRELVDELKAQLAEARRPWWKRWFSG